MKIDFSQVLTNFQGEALQMGAAAATLGLVCAEALLQADPACSVAVEHVKRFTLAQRLYPGGTHEITAEEAALMQARIAALFPTLTAGQAIKLLDAHAEGVTLIAGPSRGGSPPVRIIGEAR